MKNNLIIYLCLLFSFIILLNFSPIGKDYKDTFATFSHIFLYGFKNPQDFDTEEKIQKQMDLLNGKREKVVLNFDKLTNFEWDNMYFFGPYASKEYINKTIEIEWDYTSLEYFDTYVLIVFTNKDKVVSYIEYHGYYFEGLRDKKIERKDSTFEVTNSYIKQIKSKK